MGIKHAGGRPQEYDSKKTIKLAEEYLAGCVDTEYQRVKTDGEKSTSFELSVKVKIPTIEGLAVYLDVRRSTIYDWKEKFEEFSDIIDKIMAKQAERLLSNGLSGTYNPRIAQLMLTKHGYVERIDSDLTTKGESLNEMNYERAKKIIRRGKGSNKSNSAK